MVITKKVIKKITKEVTIDPEVVEKPKKEGANKERANREQPQLTADGKRIKRCMFCQNKTSPSYTDIVSLKRFISDRAKIVSRLRSGTCAKHQRFLSKNIKYARHLSLLPFTPKI